VSFSPTYDAIILLICLVCSMSPRPKLSTPALLDTAVTSFTPLFTSAAMEFSGMPQRPKPPNSIVIPLVTPLTASSALAQTLEEDGADAKARDMRARAQATADSI